jgi:hypothetical protein
VNWRHRIAVVVLIYLAALPLAGTICAMTCLSSTATIAAHHEDGQDCENSSASAPSKPSESESDAKIGARSPSHCGNHGATLPQVAATTAQRADDLAVISAPAASEPVGSLFGSVTAFDPLSQYTPPPGTAPSTTTPLVLRV